MTDLISREEAIEYLMTNMIWYDEFGYEEDDADLKRTAIAGLIDGIPSAQRWIPCEEEFPPPNTAVLAYAPRFGNIWAVYYDSICGWMVWSPVGNVHFPEGQGKITAWMPLPEPYKGGE